jgi:ABC-type glycerol-3-phosphate transport system substrate-binding protein
LLPAEYLPNSILRSKTPTSIVSMGLILFACFIAFQAHSKQPVVTIQLNAAINAREAFIPIFEKFEAETNIKVVPKRYIYDKNFKNNTTNLPDISYVHDSERLKKLVLLNKIEPITDIFIKEKLVGHFSPKIVDWLSYKDDVYAIPYSQTTWGFFYKKEITKKFGVIPKTWPEFLNYCLRIKKSGLSLFPISKKQTWQSAGWFQYFVIRMYDEDFYQQLTKGEVSYHSPKIQKLLILWQDAIKKGLYSYDFYEYSWKEYVPLLMRNYFSFIFISNNFGDKVYKNKAFDNIEFMPFPKINNVPIQETSPISALFISKESKNKIAAKKFLSFIAKPENQFYIANKIFVVSPNKKSSEPAHKITKMAYDVLKNADNLSPFFDRAVPESFDKPSAQALTDFVFDGDIEKLTETLEALRLAHY